MVTTRTSPTAYAALVLLPALLVFGLLRLGVSTFDVNSVGTLVTAPALASPSAATMPNAFSLGLLVLQLSVVLIAARAVGSIARHLGQPAVIGEMLAGIVLGPSVFGVLAPSLSAWLFPVHSLGFLNALSQMGVLLFLFVVGLHVDLSSLRRQRGTAVIASHASIAAPFTMGVALAFLLYPHFAPSGVPFPAFALFIGVGMSVTAFPVLARILEERRMLESPIGTLAIACAAVDDVTAWVLLAAVVALVKTGGVGLPLLWTLGGTLAFAVVMVQFVRPLARELVRRMPASDRLTTPVLSVVLIAALLSAAATESLGIHALFGAFVAGCIMPREHGFSRHISDQLSDLLVVLLLPVFFAYTGLRTQFNLVSGMDTLWAVALILGVAIVGKVGGTAIAARASGQSWYDGSRLGILMNTRGLMELVVLNIGLDLGVISPTLFAMMVIMALITTTMTVPALSLLERWSGHTVRG